MGLDYFTSDKIGGRQTDVAKELKRQPSWVLREGRLKKWLKDSPKDLKIVDLGSGSGEMEQQLLALGFHNLTAVDIDRYFPEDLMQLGVGFVKADLSRDTLDIPDASTDIVFAVQIFEHLENPWHCAREIRRIIKPGGKIYFSIPDVCSFINRVSFLFKGDFRTYGVTNNHLSVFTTSLFKKLWQDDVEICGVYHSEAWIKILGRKIRFPGDSMFGKLFSRKIAYCLIRR